MTDSAVDSFHPLVRAWFNERFPNGPTRPQTAAWPEIAAGNDVLVASPTGSGKTLTAFMVGINELFINPPADIPTGPSILYLSPLRALATDIKFNLQQPLEELAALAQAQGLDMPTIRAAVRTGDTSQSERQQHIRKPPHIYVTTPESLYNLLTSVNGRNLMRHVRTVIVDEIHAMAPDKRGSHLSLSLERLERLTVETSGRRPQRIGLSATQRPLERVARFLTGVHNDGRDVRILDCTGYRQTDFALTLPNSELEAVMSTEQFHDVLGQLCDLVAAHTTTLIFVQSRRLAERFAHQLSEALLDAGLVANADQVVAAHHGSMSHERRHHVEHLLRSGQLRALVATASLELGIDVGPVDLVVQVGSPRAIATFLQRAGRANHQVGGVPKARLLPMNRHELIEGIALLDAVNRGELDVMQMPVAPLDVLIQQIVAEVASRGEDSPDALFAMVSAAAPYAELPRSTFDEALEFSGKGLLTGRGARGAQLSLDPINQTVRPRRSASMAAIMNGGTIPDLGDYNVILDPDNIVIGQLSEDFAIESSVGDVFLLGTHAWRVTRVDQSSVRVVDADGAQPSVPFWFGESPARTWELSAAVSRLHEVIRDPLTIRDGATARDVLAAIPGVSAEAADQAVAFLSRSLDILGDLPTQSNLIVERFFDETGSMQFVVHAPFGARVNRALGLALRKKFCVTFDFELQAAADDNAVTIALGPHHSMPLESVMTMVKSTTVRETLTQAVLPLPMLKTRWRWNGVRSLAISRTISGRRRPIQHIRMDAEDLMAVAWPSLAACQENAPSGPIPIPDQILVRQTVADVMFEPLDFDNLLRVLEGVEDGSIRVHCVDVPEASPLAHGILNGQPYTFLDDAPLEERRSRTVPTPRGLGVTDAQGLPVSPERNALDPQLIAEVIATSGPRIRDRNELADFLHTYLAIRPVPEWQPFFDALLIEGRVLDSDGVWVSATRPNIVDELRDDDEAAATLLTAHLEAAGPVDIAHLVSDDLLGAGPLRGAPLTVPRAKTAIARLEQMGFAVALPDGRWCTRETFRRLNARAKAKRRHSEPAVSIAAYLNFLLHWQHVAEGSQLEGRDGLLEVIRQLQGVELAAGEWESHIFAARVSGYQPAWLDELCLAGEVTWSRLTPKVTPEDEQRGSTAPSMATPLTFMMREEFGWLMTSARHKLNVEPPRHGPAAEVYETLALNGALFRGDFAAHVTRFPSEINDGLWDLVARGWISADSFHAVRVLLKNAQRGHSVSRRSTAGRLARGVTRAPSASGSGEGRWSLIRHTSQELGRLELEDLGERVAVQLLLRWGVVTYELFDQENFGVSWLYVSRALRRLEAQGQIVGGRFIAGLKGEQYAHPEAIHLLRSAPTAAPVQLSACDPLNLTGGIVAGSRVPARPKNLITVSDGAIHSSCVAELPPSVEVPPGTLRVGQVFH